MSPILHGLLLAIAGLLTGTAVNYLADILPSRRKLSIPACPDCGKELGWRWYLLINKACPACGRGRGARVGLVLFICILGAFWISFQPPAQVSLVASWFWLAYLLLVGVIDFEHRVILHRVSVAGALAAFITRSSLSGFGRTAAGGAAGAVIMLAIYGLGILYARWSSRRRGELVGEGEALGFGDVIIGGVIGLLLGWPEVIGGLLLGILLAGTASLLLLILMLLRRSYNPNRALPFGPFLAGAAFFFLIR